MPHSYWLRPRRQRIVYSENRPYRNLSSIPLSRECFMAQKMASAAIKLELAGDYLMTDYYDGRAANTRASTSIASNQSIAATIIVFIYRFIVAIAKGAKHFCTKTVSTVMKTVQWIMQATARNVTSIVTSGRLTHRLPIFILLLLSGVWIISYPSNMPQFPRKSESLNTNFVSSLNSQSSISCENKYEMTMKKPLQNSLHSGFTHIRSDVKEKSSATLAKKSWIKQKQLAHFEAVNEKLKFLMTNVESINKNLLSSLKSQNSVSDENENQIKLLEELLQTLIVEFSEMRNLQNEYYNLFKDWCKNATAIRSNIKQEVYAALLKVLGGKVDINNGMTEDVVQQTLMTWLQDNYISRSELDSQLNVRTTSIIEKFQEMMAKEKTDSIVNLSGVNRGISESFVRSLVDKAMKTFNADKTGMADFALESGGGNVINNHCSETFTKYSTCISIFGIPLYYISNSPRTVITPDVNVGECWPFEGSIGTLVIKLSHKIKITAFSIEHIPKSISPFGHIKSAPKDFSVYSLTKPDDHSAVLLGNFTYKENGKPIQQFFPQMANVKRTQFVKLLITSNHGNLEYTCLYRFRVHGVPYSAI